MSDPTPSKKLTGSEVTAAIAAFSFFVLGLGWLMFYVFVGLTNNRTLDLDHTIYMVMLTLLGAAGMGLILFMESPKGRVTWWEILGITMIVICVIGATRAYYEKKISVFKDGDLHETPNAGVARLDENTDTLSFPEKIHGADGKEHNPEQWVIRLELPAKDLKNYPLPRNRTSAALWAVSDGKTTYEQVLPKP